MPPMPGSRHPQKVTFGLRYPLLVIQRGPEGALPPWVTAGPFYMALHVMGRITGGGYQTARLTSTPPSQQITGVYFASGKHRKESNLLHIEMIRVWCRY